MRKPITKGMIPVTLLSVIAIVSFGSVFPSSYADLAFGDSNGTQTQQINSMSLDELFSGHNIHVWDSFAIIISDSNEHAIKITNTTNLISPDGSEPTYSYNNRVYHLTAADTPTLAFPYIGQYNVTDLTDGTKIGVFNVVAKNVDISSMPLPFVPPPPIDNPTFTSSNATNSSESTSTITPTQSTPEPTPEPSPEPAPVTNNNSTSSSPPVTQPTQPPAPVTVTNPQPLVLPTILVSPKNLAKCDMLRAGEGWPPLETIMNVVVVP